MPDDIFDKGNFLGSGKSIAELLVEARLRAYQTSYTNQTTVEKKRRRAAIIQLAVELEKIREVNAFATNTGELAIEAIIEGTWEMVGYFVRDFRFREDPSLRCPAGPSSAEDENRERWKKFADILEQTYEMRPRDEGTETLQ